MSASEHAGRSQQLKMFLSTKEIMEGGWNRRGGGIFPKLVGTIDPETVESADFRDKLLPVEYEEFPDVNAPKYFEEGTHGQDIINQRDYAEARHRADEVDEARKAIRNPDAFDRAFAELGDVTKVAAEMRSQGVEDWVIEERLLKELSVRSEMVSPLHTNYIKGITWEDIESTGDRHKLKGRVKDRRRRANRTPEQRKEYLASERKRNARRSASASPEQRVEQRETKTARETKRRANRTPEQREEYLASERKRDAKRRAKKKQEAREATWDDLEAPE